MSGLQFDSVALVEPIKTVRAPEMRSERRFHWQSGLLMESVRRQTFTSWTVPFTDPDKLAQAGFFYLRTQDHVQCVFCQGIVGYWDPGDQPEVEHRKHFPNCPFMTGVATGNVPRVSTDGEVGQLYAFLDEYYAYRLGNTRPQPPAANYQTDSLRVADSGQLAFPQLNTTVSRLQTFRHWPQDVGVSPELLAEAGFFSTGLADWVQCFHCGGGLFGWRHGDDPAVDHARFYPSCPFIRILRGEETISNGWKDNIVPYVKTRPLTLSEQEAGLLLHHPIAKRLVGMGLSQVSVKEAFKQRLEARGVFCRTVTEALELVFDYEEDNRKKLQVSHTCKDAPYPTQTVNVDPPSRPSMQVAASVSSQQHFCAGSGVQDSHCPQLTSEHARLLHEVEALRHQVLREESRLLCRVCGKQRVGVVFQPCSHLHLCADCARPRDTCATCGVVIRGTLRPIIG